MSFVNDKSVKKNKDKELVTLICPDCNEEFTLTYGRYRRFPKDHVFRCNKCHRVKCVEDGRKRHANMTDEERKAWQDKMQAGKNKLTPEQKAESIRKSTEGLKRHWASLSKEERKARGNKVHTTLKNRSAEEVAEWKEKISKAQKDIWGKLSVEERKEKMASLFEGSKEYWDNITPEELERNHKLVSEGLKRYFASADPKELAKRWAKIGISNRRYWDTLTNEQKFARMSILWNAITNTGPSEKEFQKMLDKNGFIENLNYVHRFNTEQVGYINPDFFKVFGVLNKITGEINLGYHEWDFLFNTHKGLKILVDVDGSVHHPNPKSYVTNHSGRKFNYAEYMAYQDSKREYMIPDGYIAYIIDVPNDILTDKCIVTPIGKNHINNASMDLKTFINWLNLLQFTDKI